MSRYNDIEQWKKKLSQGNIPTLAKSITLVESKRAIDQNKKTNLLKAIQDIRKKSVKIGITGSPGVGKSTFLNAFISLFQDADSKVAILTIDPSSAQTGGSILGDKLRMKDLADMEQVYIRPSPSKGMLGGVNLTTWETIQVCEAAGFDYIFVETVGVGQSEIEVQYLVNEVWYLTMSRSGDEIQGIKRGILEVIDRVIVTKTDLDPNGSQKTKAFLQQTLKSISNNEKNVQFYQVSALKPDTLQTLLSDLKNISPRSLTNAQKGFWFDRGWQETLTGILESNPKFSQLHQQIKSQIENDQKDYWTAMDELKKVLEGIWKK